MPTRFVDRYRMPAVHLAAASLAAGCHGRGVVSELVKTSRSRRGIRAHGATAAAAGACALAACAPSPGQRAGGHVPARGGASAGQAAHGNADRRRRQAAPHVPAGRQGRASRTRVADQPRRHRRAWRAHLRHLPERRRPSGRGSRRTGDLELDDRRVHPVRPGGRAVGRRTASATGSARSREAQSRGHRHRQRGRCTPSLYAIQPRRVGQRRHYRYSWRAAAVATAAPTPVVGRPGAWCSSPAPRAPGTTGRPPRRRPIVPGGLRRCRLDAPRRGSAMSGGLFSDEA